ncbi:hypothetical protein RJ640_030686 [Escallonia rubra]|uniref:DYW domain-containing protein n=1 Tax=Escallonia rubra TaxID=112253 RepID=A0AA88UCK7_9ASTE|nr:hypothetical protein RJ640_030686 [Escallonia rubra]
MYKFKYQTLFIPRHSKLPLFSSYSATATALLDPLTDPNIHIAQAPKPQFSHTLDPKFYLSTLINCKNVAHVRQVHAQVATNGMLVGDLIVANKLLYIYVQHKYFDDSYPLFDTLPERNPVSWSVMVGGFSKNGDYTKCFGTFRDYIRSGEVPDNYTLPCVIRVCRDTRDVKMGRLIHNFVCMFGLRFDHFVCAALVDMYAKCRAIDDAWRLFDRMVKRDLVTWTVMIGVCAECGMANKSLALFDRMKEEGILPDKVAMVTIVNACAALGAMHKAKTVHNYISSKNFSLDVILGTAMIDMYAKCGSVDFAWETFDTMRERNVITGSAMIAAFGYHGQGRKAIDLFPMMLRSGISPNRVTFVSLLYACSHAGLVDEGRKFCSLMHGNYCIRPDVKHYTCLVDLLGRAGRFDHAMNLIENMTVEKDEGLWGALLAGCRIHGQVELAEKAAKSLLEIQPKNPGHYVLLSNIYAKAGKWGDVAKIRELMSRRRLKKIPGWTWIETENEIHQFSTGDRTHPRSKEIYTELKSLSKKLELAGYIPDTNFVLHDVDEELKLGILYTHSEKLAIAFGLVGTPEGTTIRITKNLRVCGDCHTFSKFVSAITRRVIVVRDANRFHHFREGACSCGDYW